MSSNRTTSRFPRAKKEGLELQKAGPELLVYDLDRHRAHALNPLAASIFRKCDGKTSYEKLAEHASRLTGEPVDGELARLVVARLAKAKLVEAPASAGTYSRRQFASRLKRLGLAASVMLPAVTSIVAPRPAHALSCVPNNGCGGVPDCAPCDNPGGHCKGNWRCCNGQCMPPGQAANNCGC